MTHTYPVVPALIPVVPAPKPVIPAKPGISHALAPTFSKIPDLRCAASGTTAIPGKGCAIPSSP